jgi:hypothetical protein
VLADKRVQRIEPTPEQLAALTRIRRVLGVAASRTARPRAPQHKPRTAAAR